jgi:hypothetical protein
MIKPLSESLDRSARKLALWQSSPAEQQVFGAEFLDLVLALYPRHPMLFLWASSSLPQSCPKNGDVPKFPFPTVAAVVPSAGTITL